MALSEWLLIGGIGLLLSHGMKKDDSYTYKDSFNDDADSDSDYSYDTSTINASQKAEWDRMLRVNEARLKPHADSKMVSRTKNMSV